MRIRSKSTWLVVRSRQCRTLRYPRTRRSCADMAWSPGTLKLLAISKQAYIKDHRRQGSPWCRSAADLALTISVTCHLKPTKTGRKSVQKKASKSFHKNCLQYFPACLAHREAPSLDLEWFQRLSAPPCSAGYSRYRRLCWCRQLCRNW